MSLPQATFALYGRPTGETLAEAGGALIRLMDAISAEHGASIGWRVGEWLRRCDCCGHTQPFSVEPIGWRNDGHYDLCERCSLESAR